VGRTTLLSIVCKRGNLTSQSSEKAIPPIIDFDENADYRSLSLQDLLLEIKPDKYKAKSPDFSAERLADLRVQRILTHLEHFPTVEKIVEGNQLVNHPIAEYYYAQLVYLRQTESLVGILRTMRFLERSEFLASLLERVNNKIRTKYSLELDLRSVPKRHIGSFSFIAEEDGFSKIAKIMGFGFHKAIPRERLVREASSLKSAERFNNPIPVEYDGLPESWKPFVTKLRVAIVGTAVSMLDSGDLYESGVEKISASLKQIIEEPDLRKVRREDLNLVPKVYRAGIDVIHRNVVEFDESQNSPGTVRLVFPGGVKIAAQRQSNQAYDENGEKVDLLLDFRTISSKGAVALFAMMNPDNFNKEMELQDCIDYFKGLKKNYVSLEGSVYEGYVGELPVMRPGQRYLSLCRDRTNISLDSISHAILDKPMIVPKSLDTEYKDLKALREALIKEITQ
jgi:hypothetical protein